MLLDEYDDVCKDPIGDPLYYWVQHYIDLVLDTQLPNRPMYYKILWENEEI